MKTTANRYIQPSLLTYIVFFLAISFPAMAVEYQNVDVRLSGTNQSYHQLLTGERFNMTVDATVFCTWRNVRSSLKFYAISEDELGHPFQPNLNADYDTIRRNGDLLLRTRKFNFDCDDPLTVDARMSAPQDPGLYYVIACLPTLRDEDGDVYANTDHGNWFSCSAALVLDVESRPAPDLITFMQVRPAKQEYQTNEPMTMNITVRNIGNGNSRETRARLRRSPFPNANLTNSFQLAEIEIPPLAPNESITRRMQVSTQEQARTDYYIGCVSGSAWGADNEIRDGYSDVEYWRDNNCSRAVEIRTTNSSVPSVYVESLQPAQATVAPSAPIILDAALHNGEQREFKGGSVIYRKKLPLFRRLNTTAPPYRFSRLPLTILTSDITGSELVDKAGILLPPGTTHAQRELEAPLSPGRYQYTMCISHGREIIGCANSAEVVVR